MATPLDLPPIHFEIPKEFIGEAVVVQYAIPLPGKSELGSAGIIFPGMEGKLVGLLDCSVWLETKLKDGSLCDEIVPMNRIQKVTRKRPGTGVEKKSPLDIR